MENYKYQLPTEFATKWVEALRSGEYEQTYFDYKGFDRDCFCAIGLSYKANGYLFRNRYLVDEQKKDFIYEQYPDLWKAITKMNDSDRKPFSEIADWIEANVQFI